MVRVSRLLGRCLREANFYEKALFVKVDVATALWRKQLLCALRAMLLFALSGSSLGSSVHYEIRLFELEALQSSERPSWKGRPSSLAQSPLEIRSAIGQRKPWPSATLGLPRRFFCQGIFTSSVLHGLSFKLPPPALGSDVRCRADHRPLL